MSFDTNISLEAQPRAAKGKNAARRLRREGMVPVAVYGGGQVATGAIATRELAAILRAHGGRNKIFNLVADGESGPVKIAELQLDPVKGHLLHADLMRISLTEKTEFEVPVEIVGEADGVRNFGGLLDIPTHSLKIRCLPGDLPDSIQVNVTALGIGHHLRVSDLQIDREKIEVLADPSVIIATVVAPRVAEEPVAEVATEGVAEPEVIKKGKAEEEES
jgi:large subunit ribosomal protein L25